MMAIAEALGLTLPGASSIPAADSSHPRMCGVAGRRIVDMVWEESDPRPDFDSRRFRQRHQGPHGDGRLDQCHHPCGRDGAPRGHCARHAALRRDLARDPVLANVRPSGKYLMEDFFYAGGLRALMLQLKDRLDLSARTVTGRTLGENIEGAEVYLPDVIHSLADPIYGEGANRGPDRQSRAARLRDEAGRRRPALPQASRARTRLRGLQPHGARVSSATTSRSRPTMCWCSRTQGPRAGPACRNGACCRSRKSWCRRACATWFASRYGRMSGTSYGACILHVAPESYVGGPLAFVQTGDEIEIDRRGAPHPSGMSPRTSSPAGAPPGRRRRRTTCVATAQCSPPISARPTRAATSTSSPARSKSPSRRFIERRAAQSFEG